MDAAFIWNLSKLGRIGSRRLRSEDDFVDRLNYQYSSVLLFLFIGLIGIRQYVGKPIQCWIPQEFTRGWEEYAENYCWVANTYFAPVQHRLPPVPDRRELLLVYYQWAPIVLAAQALLFYIPCLTWRLYMAQSGFNLQRILQMAAETNELMPETANRTVSILANYIRTCAQRQRAAKCSTARFGTYTRLSNEAPKRTRCTRYDKHKSGNGISEHSEPYQNERNAERVGTDSQQPVTIQSLQINSIHDHPYESVERPNPVRVRRPAPPPPALSVGTDLVSQKPTTGMSQMNVQGIRAPTSITKYSTKHFNPSLGNMDYTKAKLPKPWTKRKAEAVATKIKVHNSAKTVNFFSTRVLPRCGKMYGNFLVTLYMVIKVCYVINAVGQLHLMQAFVGTKYPWYGASVLTDLIKGREWHQSGNFPRVTFCDLEAKKLGKNHVYTLQCVLPLNMFLEKIYIILWFWHVAIATITFINLFVWLHRIFSSWSRVQFVQSHLRIHGLQAEGSDEINTFVESHLGLDGFFIIRLISLNCGGTLACDLVVDLWRTFTHPSALRSRHCVGNTYHPNFQPEVNDFIHTWSSSQNDRELSHPNDEATTVHLQPLAKHHIADHRFQTDYRDLRSKHRRDKGKNQLGGAGSLCQSASVYYEPVDIQNGAYFERTMLLAVASAGTSMMHHKIWHQKNGFADDIV